MTAVSHIRPILTEISPMWITVIEASHIWTTVTEVSHTSRLQFMGATEAPEEALAGMDVFAYPTKGESVGWVVLAAIWIHVSVCIYTYTACICIHRRMHGCICGCIHWWVVLEAMAICIHMHMHTCTFHTHICMHVCMHRWVVLEAMAMGLPVISSYMYACLYA